ncbi:uncharacterized protein [Nicotiana tomentosiformis]|uniref:uncharacterized protein n=1 Tax=Nicotiana tomentosiformis TaxID=4098 RepID=UPI00388CCC8C
MGRGATQPANSAATTSTAPSARRTLAPAGRGAARGGAQNSGGPNRFYAMQRHRESETSPDVVTGILSIQSHYVYAPIDPGSTLSYVTPYVAMEFGIEPEQLHESFSVSTPVGQSILAARVYMDCVVTLRGRDTVADLIELRMVGFDMIMGMDWLYSYFAKLDCRTRTVRFEFPNEPVIQWKDDNVVPKVCIDDIRVYTQSREGHADHLKIVLQTLYQHKLYEKFSKCEFWLELVTFLGHVVSSEGIKLDPRKIAAVKNWPRPTSPIEIRSFLGLDG